MLDRDGKLLMLRVGGDTLIDPSWREPVLENIDEQARLADFALMRTAASAFQSLAVPASLEQLRRAGLQAGLSVPESLDASNLAEDPELSPAPECRTRVLRKRRIPATRARRISGTANGFCG